MFSGAIGRICQIPDDARLPVSTASKNRARKGLAAPPDRVAQSAAGRGLYPKLSNPDAPDYDDWVNECASTCRARDGGSASPSVTR